MKKMKWNGDHLSNYKDETLVEGVTTSYFADDIDMRHYIARQRNRNSWRNAIAELLRDFNFDEFEPIYYCLRHNRIEDGSHRYFIACQKRIPKLNVIIGAECFKRIRSKTKEFDFEEIMRQYGIDLTVKDYKWVNALAKDKIPHFSSIVDFAGKSHLDIGCNVGFMCIEAYKRGADSSVGLEIKQNLVETANLILDHFRIPDERVVISRGDFRGLSYPPGFDIITCFGLLHYFKMAEYPVLFDKMCSMCNETLILEMRVPKNKTSTLTDKGGQTLPSDSWVIKRLNENGFYVTKSLHRGTDRNLYVSEKIKNGG